MDVGKPWIRHIHRLTHTKTHMPLIHTYIEKSIYSRAVGAC